MLILSKLLIADTYNHKIKLLDPSAPVEVVSDNAAPSEIKLPAR